MNATARVTSKGQITVPKAVRDALGVHEGDQLHFRVVGDRAVIARTPDFSELYGSVEVPEHLKGLSLDELLAIEQAAAHT